MQITAHRPVICTRSAHKTWARLVGIAWAAVVAVGHMFALPAFPLWSLLIIALSVLIIYGLAGGLEEG